MVSKLTDKSSDHHIPTMSTFTEVAAGYKGEILFVNIPGSEKGILDYFGLKSVLKCHHQTPTPTTNPVINDIAKYFFHGVIFFTC